MASLFKKKALVELESLIDINMLLMVEKGIRGRICHALHTDTKANNKYMTNYAKNIDCNSVECNSSESSYLICLDMNNLHG